VCHLQDDDDAQAILSNTLIKQHTKILSASNSANANAQNSPPHSGRSLYNHTGYDQGPGSSMLNANNLSTPEDRPESTKTVSNLTVEISSDERSIPVRTEGLDIKSGESENKKSEKKKEVSGWLLPLRPTWKPVIDSSIFEGVVTMLILTNTITLALDHYGIEESTVRDLVVINIILYIAFAVEALGKIAGLGMLEYFSDGFNKFDFFVVVLTTAEMFMSQGSPLLSALRCFRLLRLLKLIRLWPSLGQQIKAILSSLNDLLYFSLLLCMFLFIFAVMGMQFFPDTLYAKDGTALRESYGNFGWAFLTTFQILTGENWNELMYSGVNYLGWSAVFYFGTIFIVGNYIMLSAFLAIMFSNFERIEDNQAVWYKELYKQMKTKLTCCNRGGTENKVVPNNNLDDTSVESKNNPKEKGSAVINTDDEARVGVGQQPQPQEEEQLELILIKGNKMDNLLQHSDIAAELPDLKLTIYGKSLGLFSVHNAARQWMVSVVNSSQFEGLITVCIFISVILLALDEPGVDPDSDFAASMFEADVVMTVIFLLEFIMKVFAYGLIMSEGTYLRDRWNVLDFVIVIVSVLNIFLSNLAFFRSFRLLRVLKSLRTLRMISRLDTLRLIVQSILSTLPALGNVYLIGQFVFTVFAIVGCQLFKGKLRMCFGPDDSVLDGVDEVDCADHDGVWRNGDTSFDNFGESMLALYELSSLEMWPTTL